MRVGRTYVYTRDSRSSSATAFIVLAAIAGAVGVWTSYESIKSFSKYRDTKSSLSNLIVYPSTAGLGYGSVFDPRNTGAVVHVNIPQSDLLYQHNVYDPVFNVYVPGAVTMNRRVEYCQWQEHVFETSRKNDDGTETVSRTYTYTKGWHSHTINSLLFDQPAAHHNPQRHPVQEGQVDVTGVASSKGFSISAPHMLYLKGETVPFYFRPESLQGFIQSPAYLNDKFFYTGNNGWFLSKYEPSFAEQALKMTAQYVEGTLFDFQLGDLFSVCDAGDVRVVLEGKVLQNGVSAIALQNADGSLSPFKSLQGRDMMLVREGQVSAQEMIEREIGDRFSTLLWFVIGAIVSLGLSGLFGYLFKKESDKKVENSNEKSE